jgi:ferritin-like metal-binding protein YciE
MESLRELFVHELSDIYSAEKQMTQALPKMAKAASFPELQKAFEKHLKETEGQIKRLDQVFKLIGEKPKRIKCKGMEGLVEEGKELLEEKKTSEPATIDAGLIAAAQRVEHYEIAAYGTVRNYAEALGEKKAATLLQETLDEEGDTDRKLTDLAVSKINPAAVNGA